MTDETKNDGRVMRIKPNVYALAGLGLVYRTSVGWFAKPLTGADSTGLWWGAEIGPLPRKSDAVSALRMIE